MSVKNYFIAVTAFVLLQSCTGNQPKGNEVALPSEVIDTTTRPNPYANSKVEVSVFNNDTTTNKNLGGFGYNILIDGKPYVHQPHIPAVAGNKGFATFDAANKAGTFVAYKIKNNIMPPSITEHELDSVGALY